MSHSTILHQGVFEDTPGGIVCQDMEVTLKGKQERQVSPQQTPTFTSLAMNFPGSHCKTRDRVRSPTHTSVILGN